MPDNQTTERPKFNPEQREQAKLAVAILTGEGDFTKDDKLVLELRRFRHPDSASDMLFVTSPTFSGLMVGGKDYEHAMAQTKEVAEVMHRWIEEQARDQ